MTATGIASVFSAEDERKNLQLVYCTRRGMVARSTSRSNPPTRITTKHTKYHEGFIPGVWFSIVHLVTLVVNGLAPSI
jgi:hypothetical protein